MRTNFANKAIAPREVPTAEPTPARIDLTPHPNLAEALRDMPATMLRLAEKTKTAKRGEQDGLRAQVELERLDARRVELELKAARKDPANDERLKEFQRRIADLEGRIAAIDQEMVAVDARTAERIERGGPLFTELSDGTQRMVQILASLQPVYDALVEREEAFRTLMLDFQPNGLIAMAWLPSSHNGDSVLTILRRLEPVFGKNGLFKTVQREARDAGLNGEPRS